MPLGFELIEDAVPNMTTMICTSGRIRLSRRVIFGLLSLAVFDPANAGQEAGDGYFLSLGQEHFFEINRWWGRRKTFEDIVDTYNLIKVKLDFGDWMLKLSNP